MSISPIPAFYSGPLQTTLPFGFNGRVISLPAQVHEPLNWKEELALAEECRKQGIALLWELDLGLFNALPQPLAQQSQFASLRLGMEHWLQEIAPYFRENTAGMILYKGPLVWDSISRTEALNYLQALTSHWPDAIPLYVLLDPMIGQPLSLTQELFFSQKESFGRISPCLAPGRYLPLERISLGWNNYSPYGYIADQILSPSFPTPREAICLSSQLPYTPEDWNTWEKGLEKLYKTKQPFRITSEAYLAAEWEELDNLILSRKGWSLVGERTVKGFLATGGTVTFIEDL